MKQNFNPIKPLTDLRDVLNFLEFLVYECKAVYEPSDEATDFTKYENLDNHKPSWTKQEGIILNQRLAEAKEVCNNNDEDFEKFASENLAVITNKFKGKLVNR